MVQWVLFEICANTTTGVNHFSSCQYTELFFYYYYLNAVSCHISQTTPHKIHTNYVVAVFVGLLLDPTCISICSLAHIVPSNVQCRTRILIKQMQHSENVSGTALDWVLKLSKHSLSNCANGAAFDRKNEYSSSVHCTSKNVHYMSFNIYIRYRTTVWKICSREYYKSALFSVIKMIIIPPTRKLLLWHLGLFLAEIRCSQTVALLRAQTPRASLAFQLHKCVYEGVKRGAWPQGVCMTDGDRAWEERKKCQKWERNENTQTIHKSPNDHLLYRCISFRFPLSLIIPFFPNPLWSPNTFHSLPFWVWILIYRQIFSSRTFSPWPSAPNLTLIFLFSCCA